MTWKTFFSTRSMTRRRPARRQSRSAHDLTRRFGFKPQLEFLEDRLAPAGALSLTIAGSETYGAGAAFTVNATGLLLTNHGGAGNSGDNIEITNHTHTATYSTGPNSLTTNLANTTGSATGNLLTTLPVAAGNYTLYAHDVTDPADVSDSGGTPFSVTAAHTNVAVTPASPSVTYGQTPTFKATVTNTDSTGVQPTGTVQFALDGSPIGGALPLTGHGANTATVSSSPVMNLTVSGGQNYTITSVYSRLTTTSNFQTGTSGHTNAFTVSAANTSVSVTTPSVTYNQSPQITATVKDTSTTAQPTGSVQFQETASGGVNINLGTFSLSGAGANSATATTNAVTSLTPAGSPYTITATYSRLTTTSNFQTGTHNSTSFSVSAASTSVSVTPLSPTVTFGQNPTFLATVKNTSSTGVQPTGTLRFELDGSPIGSVLALTGTGANTATVSSSAVMNLTHAGSPYTITAVYSRLTTTSNFQTGTSGHTNAFTVAAANTSVTVTPASPSVVTGQVIAFSAKVSNTSTTGVIPTGTVKFENNGVQFGATINLPGGAGSTTTLTSAVTSFTAASGSHTITAVYANSDGNFVSNNGSTNPFTANQASTSTSDVSSSATSAIYGKPVTLTATVTVTGLGAGTLAGTVTFSDQSGALGTGSPNVSGVATFSSTAIAAGTHTITASYGSDPNFATSNDTGGTNLKVTITQSTSTTSDVRSSSGSPLYGQPVTFSATISALSGGGIPAGTVSFLQGATTLGTGTVGLTGVATFSSASLTAGTHTITASYAGNSNYTGSNDASSAVPLQQEVSLGTTSTSDVSASTNGTAFGVPVTLTATVTNSAVGGITVPTGRVTFSVGATSVGTGTLNGAGVATAAVLTLAVGNDTVTASYAGDLNFTGSNDKASGTPLVETIAGQATSSTTVTAPDGVGSLIYFGKPVTFTATVADTSAGSVATPTGSVSFALKSGATTVNGSGTLNSAGVATFSTSSLGSGTYSVTATYATNTNFVGSSNAVIPTTVITAAPTTVVVQTSTTNLSFGQGWAATAHVFAKAGFGVGTPGTTKFGPNGGGKVVFSAIVTTNAMAGSFSSGATFTIPLGSAAHQFYRRRNPEQPCLPARGPWPPARGAHHLHRPRHYQLGVAGHLHN